MSRFFDADDFFRTFEELNQEPYINFPTADVVDRNECSKCVLHPFKQLREQLETNMVEVVHGEWIPSRFKTLREDGWCECSVCGVGNKLYDRGVRKSDVPHIDGKSYELKNIANYCPNCGADMRPRTEKIYVPKEDFEVE